MLKQRATLIRAGERLEFFNVYGSFGGVFAAMLLSDSPNALMDQSWSFLKDRDNGIQTTTDAQVLFDRISDIVTDPNERVACAVILWIDGVNLATDGKVESVGITVVERIDRDPTAAVLVDGLSSRAVATIQAAVKQWVNDSGVAREPEPTPEPPSSDR